MTNRWLEALRWLALAAILTVCAVSEWHAGVTAGLHPWVAAALPMAVDIYVVTAILSDYDARAALTTLAGTVMVGVLSTALIEGEPSRQARLAAAVWVGVMAPWVLYRIDRAVKHDIAQRAAQRAAKLAEEKRATAAQKAAQEAPARVAVATQKAARVTAQTSRKAARVTAQTAPQKAAQVAAQADDATRVPAGERPTWFARKLRENPDRVDWSARQWAETTGLNLRTTQAALRAARDLSARPLRVVNE